MATNLPARQAPASRAPQSRHLGAFSRDLVEFGLHDKSKQRLLAFFARRPDFTLTLSADELKRIVTSGALVPQWLEGFLSLEIKAAEADADRRGASQHAI